MSSGIRFGSDVVAAAWYAELKELPEVIATVGDKIANLTAYPAPYDFPACIHYMESPGMYSGAIGAGANQETMRWVTRFTCEGESNEILKAAAEEAWTHFESRVWSYTYRGEEYQIEALVDGEWPLTSEVDGQTIYRALGFYSKVTLSIYG